MNQWIGISGIYIIIIYISSFYFQTENKNQVSSPTVNVMIARRKCDISSKWKFPEMGVPPKHPFQIGIFHDINIHKPSSYWKSSISWETPNAEAITRPSRFFGAPAAMATHGSPATLLPRASRRGGLAATARGEPRWSCKLGTGRGHGETRDMLKQQGLTFFDNMALIMCKLMQFMQ